MTDKKTEEQIKKSSSFRKFITYYFETEIPPNAILYTYIDPYTIDELSPEEKKVAEKMLIEALKKEIKEIWLHGLEDIKSKECYEFLLELFSKEKDITMKARLAYSLMRIDGNAPIYNFLEEVLESSAGEKAKQNALNAISWLIEFYTIHDNATKDLITKALKNSMMDKAKAVRMHAYDLLKNFFDMRDFTPKNDQIEELLGKGKSKKDFQRALEMFMERVESKEEIPFSKKVLKKYVDELLKTSPSIAKEKCDICKRIPKHLHADLAAGESLPEIVSQLNDVLIFAYYKDKVKQCPICGRLYIYDYEYEFLVPRSEEDESLYQATPKAVNDLVTRFLKYHPFKKIIYCKGYLKIDY